MNKKLHFAPELVSLVLSGEKDVTWRLWDDKNLTKGDVLDFYESGTEKYFATALITKVVEKKFGNINDEDKKGHEAVRSKKEMYERYSMFYKRKVYPSTKVKIIKFKLVKG